MGSDGAVGGFPSAYAPSMGVPGGGKGGKPRAFGADAGSFAGGGPQPGTMDTLCVLGMREKSLTEQSISEWFSQCPGFVTCLFNQRLGGCFIKFQSAEEAEAAM